MRYALILFLLIGSLQIFAAAPVTEKLWPGEPPMGQGRGDVPTLTIYLADDQIANGTAVVVCPGGGYATLAMQHEGHQVARYFNSIGVSAFILRYRHGPKYHHPVPLLDVQRAIRTVRARSEEFNVYPDRVGVMGFSAGGHLASTAGTHFGDGDSQSDDPIEKVSSRPDFMILVYPVISMTEEYTHKGSRRHLLSDNPDPKLAESLSNDRQVTTNTPPTFLVLADDDTVVPPANSVSFYMALNKAGVSAEMHIFEKGGHGFGLAPFDPVLGEWPRLLEDWLRERGMLE